MKKALAASITALFITGCASIIDGGSQPVTFKSVPEAASISITNRSGEKIHSGSTPITVALKRGAGYFKSEVYSVRIEKEGYRPKDVTVTGSVNGWYIGNIIFGGLIGFLIVDPITGAMYNLAPEAVTASLEAMEVNTSATERSLTVVMAEDVPAEVWQHAQLLQTK